MSSPVRGVETHVLVRGRGVISKKTSEWNTHESFHGTFHLPRTPLG